MTSTVAGDEIGSSEIPGTIACSDASTTTSSWAGAGTTASLGGAVTTGCPAAWDGIS